MLSTEKSILNAADYLLYKAADEKSSKKLKFKIIEIFDMAQRSLKQLTDYIDNQVQGNPRKKNESIRTPWLRNRSQIK